MILDIAFQPIVELASGRVYGYEALGRPRTPGGQALSIAALLAQARAAGELLALDRALRRRALECIELGEQDPLLDRERLAAMYPSYASQGFSIALDDFGAGHATLSRLVEVRPQFVKLDPALVHGVADDPMRTSLLRAFAGFAAEAGIVLVAEGIERAEDLAFVLAAGIPLGQGYLLGRPAPLDRAA